MPAKERKYLHSDWRHLNLLNMLRTWVRATEQGLRVLALLRQLCGETLEDLSSLHSLF